jgi:SAM-dependent methyltransferase
MFKSVLKKILYNLWPSNLLNPQQEVDTWVTRKLSELPAGARILDAGAGPQPYRKYCKHLKYVSQDFAAYDGKGDGTALQADGFSYKGLDIVSDICSIPEPDESFDAVLCTEVFEHIPDPAGALKEFFRLLKPGGKIVLTAPFFSLSHFSPYHFVSGLSRYWWDHWLVKVGYSKFDIVSSGGFFDFLAQLVKITPGISKKYSRHIIQIPILYFQCIVMILLLSFSKHRNDRSNELVCFGHFIYAEK